MDKQQLKRAFDAFNPTDKQKQRMFENINKKVYGKRVINFKKIYIHLAGAAIAVFVFAASIAMFNSSAGHMQTQIVKNTPSDVTSYALSKASEQDGMQNLTRQLQHTHTYQLTYEQFCKKAGVDITNLAKIPDDMQNITQSESSFVDGEVENWDITYIGKGERSISINLSLDANKNNEYFENKKFVKTHINGNEAVVFYDDSYTVYTKVKNLSCKVTGVKTTEKEISQLLVSILK